MNNITNMLEYSLNKFTDEVFKEVSDTIQKKRSAQCPIPMITRRIFEDHYLDIVGYGWERKNPSVVDTATTIVQEYLESFGDC